jgi:hypothetical protein
VLSPAADNWLLFLANAKFASPARRALAAAAEIGSCS